MLTRSKGFLCNTQSNAVGISYCCYSPYFRQRDLRLEVILSSVHDHPAVGTRAWPGQPEGKVFARHTLALYLRFREEFLGVGGSRAPNSIPLSLPGLLKKTKVTHWRVFKSTFDDFGPKNSYGFFSECHRHCLAKPWLQLLPTPWILPSLLHFARFHSNTASCLEHRPPLFL